MGVCVGVCVCVWVCVRGLYLGFSEARFTLIQVGLHFAHNLFVGQRHERVGMIEVCCDDRAWL